MSKEHYNDHTVYLFLSSVLQILHIVIPGCIVCLVDKGHHLHINLFSLCSSNKMPLMHWQLMHRHGNQGRPSIYYLARGASSNVTWLHSLKSLDLWCSFVLLLIYLWL